MEGNNKRPPFPQANDLEKIVQIINVPNEDTVLNDDALGSYLDGITSRQARYYIAAAKYLGILDANKLLHLLLPNRQYSFLSHNKQVFCQEHPVSLCARQHHYILQI